MEWWRTRRTKTTVGQWKGRTEIKGQWISMSLTTIKGNFKKKIILARNI